jgi:ABC-2 type transport system permease protein
MSFTLGFADLGRGMNELWLSARLAQNELTQRYARSLMGPFWITITQGLYAAVLGVLVSALFNQTATKVLPIIVVGMMIWNFITGVLLDSCYAFAANRQHLLNTDIPFSTFNNLTIFRHLLVLAHHFIAGVCIVRRCAWSRSLEGAFGIAACVDLSLRFVIDGGTNCGSISRYGVFNTVSDYCRGGGYSGLVVA